MCGSGEHKMELLLHYGFVPTSSTKVGKAVSVEIVELYGHMFASACSNSGDFAWALKCNSSLVCLL